MNSQVESDIDNLEWLQELTDSLEQDVELCFNCDLPPIIRSYRTPFGVPRFVLFYQCDNVSSTTKHFEIDGHLAGECITDSLNRECEDIQVFESFTLANSILTVWTCMSGFDCNNTDKSLLFPQYEIVPSSDLCNPEQINLTVSHPFDSYLWISPDGTMSDLNTYMVDQFGIHDLIISNESGCFDTTSLDVNQDLVLTHEIEGRNSICLEDPAMLSISGYSRYLWSTGDTTSYTTVTEEGNVSVIVYNEMGCSETLSVAVRDARNEEIHIVTDQDEIYSSQDIRFYLELESLVEEDLEGIIWSFGNQEIEGPELIVQVESALTLSVSAIGPSGCLLVDEIYIEPLPLNRDVYIPNAFYPFSQNGNSHFYIRSIENTINLIELSIYDRWGNEVFSNLDGIMNDPSSGWGGRMGGKVMAAGVYIYKVVVEYADMNRETLHGSVFLSN